MSRTNETRHIEWHETCKCKCTLDESICNNKQRWNKYNFWCECKELFGKGMCNKGCIWNPSNCDSEYDKSCNVEEYLDYKNCKCRKRIVDKLFEECSEDIDGNEMIYNITFNVTPLNDYKRVCNTRATCIVLSVIFSVINISISSVFIYFYWYLKKTTFVLSLILILKQQFIRCNSIEYINEQYKRNKH